MNGNSKPAGGRSRPTNNQLLYKAHFRWQHYTSPLAPGIDLPDGTEACASVTSAFLQVLATIHRVESCRSDRTRNILHLLSTNTRRTKVVELSSGTHRVADELRRHSLADGEGGHYSTNLDRNRYGSDNNYLFTVTKFNLDCLGLCPCLVDIEIVDTRNGNETQVVAAGAGACSCASPARKERADASHFAGSAGAGGGGGNGGGPRPAASPLDMRRVASTGHLSSGMKRVPSVPTMRRPPSSGRLADYHRGGGGGEREPGDEPRGTRSRNSGGGSELFDALLLAATEDRGLGARDELPVTSLHYPNAALARQRSRPWHSEVDSLQNAIDAFKAEPEEVGTGGLSRMRSRRMLRRNSVSMIIENPVLAQTGAAESLLLNHYPPFQALPPLRSPQQAPPAAVGGGGPAAAKERGGGDAAEASVRSHEGDTESKDEVEVEADEHDAFREGLLRHYHKQSSAVNLSRMAHPAELRRLQDELRQLREDSRALEGELEEARMREKEARDAGAASAAELAQAQTLTRRAADVIQRLKQELHKVGGPAPSLEAAAAPGATPTAAVGPAAAGGAANGDGAPAAEAAVDGVSAELAALLGNDLAAGLEAELAGVRTSEKEIEALRAELKGARRALAREEERRRDAESKLAVLTAALGGPAAAAAALRHAAAAAAASQHHPAAAGYAAAAFMPPLGYGPAMALPPPMFALPPLGPYSMHPAAAAHHSAFRVPAGHHGGGGGMQKVASMPLLGPGMVSQHHLPIAPLGAAEREWASGGGAGGREGRKRRGGSTPIPEDEPDEAPQRKRRVEKGAAEPALAANGSDDEMGDDAEGTDEEGPLLSGDAADASPAALLCSLGAMSPAVGGARQAACDGRAVSQPGVKPGEGHALGSASPQHPPGVATPKDLPLLPADPLTGASAAPLGLPQGQAAQNGTEVVTGQMGGQLEGPQQQGEGAPPGREGAAADGAAKLGAAAQLLTALAQ